MCAGCVLTVALLAFISTVDFQRDGGGTARSDNPNGVLLRSVARDNAAATTGEATLGNGIGMYPALRRNATANGSVCRYDGHCNVGHTCAVAPNGNGGTCEPFAAVSRSPPASAFTSSQPPSGCVAACLRELRIDEHWYHESWPVVEWTEDVTSARGRPNPGCLVVYHREPQGDHFAYLDEQDRKERWTDVPPSLKDWVNHRFRHVVRVDPFSPDPTDQKWTALCHGQCQSDADCVTTNDGSSTVPGFVCREGVCARNPLFWGPDLPTKDTPRSEMPAAANMVLVTGATGGYLSGLTNLAASARYWAPQYKMVVYNLGGMTPQDVARIRSWSNILAVEWEDGVPAQYPPHVHEGKIYAWKPIIVNETVHKYGSIFWLDSGSTLAGPVQPVQEALQRYGIALMKGQDLDMRPKAHEKTFEWFGYNKQAMSWGPHFSGNTQAFLYPSRYIDTVVIPNCKCALDRTCIAPSGSGLTNHRYDQTTISILAYAPKVRLPHYTEFLAAQSGQLNPNLLEPSFKLVWTARQGCQFYTSRDPELRGRPPDGGYYHYLPDPNPGAGSGGAVSSGRRVEAVAAGKAATPPDRHHLYVGPNSLEGGDEIPDNRAAALQVGHSIHGGGDGGSGGVGPDHRVAPSDLRRQALERMHLSRLQRSQPR